MTASGKGNEAFSTDEHGQKADADIHWPILDAVDDTKFREQSFMRAVQAAFLRRTQRECLGSTWPTFQTRRPRKVSTSLLVPDTLW
jgi:hypothetical protein